jgi:hypothetical protein
MKQQPACKPSLLISRELEFLASAEVGIIGWEERTLSAVWEAI